MEDSVFDPSVTDNALLECSPIIFYCFMESQQARKIHIQVSMHNHPSL